MGGSNTLFSCTHARSTCCAAGKREGSPSRKEQVIPPGSYTAPHTTAKNKREFTVVPLPAVHGPAGRHAGYRKIGPDLQECFYQESGKRGRATLGLSERWVSVYCLQMKHLCQYLSRSGRPLCYPAMVATAYAGHLFLLAMLNRAMNLEARLPVHPAGWLCRQLMPGIAICGETGYNVLMLDALICETLALLPLWYLLWSRRVFWGFLVLWVLSLAALLFTVNI